MELRQAHKDALDLLKLVDDYCIKENMIYTLDESTLIALDRVDFSQCAPRICIATEIDNFKKIRAYLSDFCNENDGYSLHDYSNTEQFYTPDMWFVKHSRVKLTPEREKEEFYYGVTLIILPLYYAGNTIGEWKKINKYFDENMLPMYYRKMLKKKPVQTYIHQLPRRIRTDRYIKKRDFSKISDIISFLESKEKSEYIFYPASSTKYSGINICQSTFNSKIAKLTYSNFWSKVERIKYYGVECYCLKEKEKLIGLVPHEIIENTIKPKKSELILNGGEELRRVQLIQIELLTEFDRICRKYDIKYNIQFGSLIGAMRHKGFIPWDDDIDVTMYYKDCDRLYEIMEKELDKEKYFYRCEQTEPNHHLIFNHLEHNGTVFTKAGRDKLTHKIGVFIDIFPMYDAAPNAFIDFFHTRVCRFWRTALWSTVGADSEKNPLKRAYYRQLAKMGNEKCRAKFLKHATRYENKDGRVKFWTSIDRSPYNVDLVRKDNFENAIEVEFEGKKFLAPAHYEGSLEFCFSPDWIYFPNVSGRVPTHDAMIDIGDLYKYD